MCHRSLTTTIPSTPNLASSGFLRCNRLGDRLGNLALKCKNIGKVSIIGLGPTRNSGDGVDKLHTNANSVAGPLNATEQKLAGLRRLVSTGGLHVPCCKSRDNLTLDASSELMISFVRVETGERQNRDRRLIRRYCRRRRCDGGTRDVSAPLEKSIRKDGGADDDCCEDNGTVHKG